MAKYASCPISQELVDARLTKIYSFITLTAISVFLFTPFKEIVFLLTVDFVIRVIVGVKYSPICRLIKQVLKCGNFPTHMVNAGPKKFAAKIGLIFTVLISVGILADFPNFSLFFGVLTFVAVGLEAFFDLCVACMIYSKLPSRFRK